VALLLEGAVAREVDGLRRALGDPSLERIPPHLTLVPPVNVGVSELPGALAVLRAGAARQRGPMTLTLGSVSTFLPANPVVYLAVGGELPALRRLRDDVFRPPLERMLSWPWVPHVTLADGIPEDRIEPALAVLSGYAVVATIDRVVVLEEGPGRVWASLADAMLGPPARVGTGGLAIELTAGRLMDPEASQDPVPDSSLLEPIVVTARREGIVVGFARAWADQVGAHVAVEVRPEFQRQGIGSHLLAQVEALARSAGWQFPVLEAEGPCAFFEARSHWSVATRTPQRRTRPAS
jgi:GNAT superfamily N-acetyltransferase